MQYRSKSLKPLYHTMITPTVVLRENSVPIPKYGKNPETILCNCQAKTSIFLSAHHVTPPTIKSLSKVVFYIYHISFSS